MIFITVLYLLKYGTLDTLRGDKVKITLFSNTESGRTLMLHNIDDSRYIAAVRYAVIVQEKLSSCWSRGIVDKMCVY